MLCISKRSTKIILDAHDFSVARTRMYKYHWLTSAHSICLGLSPESDQFLWWEVLLVGQERSKSSPVTKSRVLTHEMPQLGVCGFLLSSSYSAPALPLDRWSCWWFCTAVLFCNYILLFFCKYVFFNVLILPASLFYLCKVYNILHIADRDHVCDVVYLHFCISLQFYTFLFLILPAAMFYLSKVYSFLHIACWTLCGNDVTTEMCYCGQVCFTMPPMCGTS